MSAAETFVVVRRGPDFTEAEFGEAMAVGPCLCAEIDASDRPCLTCEAQARLGHSAAAVLGASE